jgi:hypothetical protein
MYLDLKPPEMDDMEFSRLNKNNFKMLKKIVI